MRKVSRKLHWGRGGGFLKHKGKGIKRLDFYNSSDRQMLKGGANREFDDEMAEDINCKELLRKYGPEGLLVIADKLKEVAWKDVQDGIEQSLTVDEACYDNVLKKIKGNE
jgi:hypothetical protein